MDALRAPDNITIIEPLDVIEARKLVDDIRTHLDASSVLILQLYERKGHTALGYQSWSDCVQAEFTLSHTRVYQMLDYARIRREIVTYLLASESTFVDSLPLNEAQARQLKRVPQGQRGVVYEQVLSMTRGTPTAAVVRQLIDANYGVSPSVVPLNHPTPSVEDRAMMLRVHLSTTIWDMSDDDVIARFG